MHEIMSHMEAYHTLMQHGRGSGALMVSSEEANWVCAMFDQLKMCLFYVSVLFLYRLLSRKSICMVAREEWNGECTLRVRVLLFLMVVVSHLLSRN